MAGAGTGGSKGQAVLEFFEKNGPATRQEAADAVGCTIARVGEVVRAHGNFKKLDDGRWQIKPQPKRRSRKAGA